MGRVEVIPLAAEHVGECGRLLAARHAAQHAAHPLLTPRFLDPQVATAAVTALLADPTASGAVATEGGRVVGYLVGRHRPQAVWGPNVWVEAAGFATREPEHVRDLYAVAATRWVAEGRTAHYVLTPARPQLVDPWFRLGFGAQHAHAIRAAGPAAPGAVRSPATIRAATTDDAATLAPLDALLPLHLHAAPVFAPVPVPDLSDSVAEWVETLADPSYATFVAEIDGTAVGCALACSVERSSEHTGLARPDDAAILGFAVVAPTARGRGVGQALGAAVLSWARDAGYRSVVSDWRVTNLPSARTWPRLGFMETFLRLHRLLGY